MSVRRKYRLALFLFGFCSFFALSLLKADPRNPLPETPSQVWQNDLDLRDMIVSRISLNGSKYCIDDPSFCVDPDTGNVMMGIISTAHALFIFRNSNTTETILLQNDGTNALSEARILLDTNSGAGDPYVRWNVAVASFNMGIDNSDSDILKISTSASLSSGGDAWKMTTDGEITQPLQPSFLVTAPVNTTNVTGSNETVDIEYDVEITDQGSNFNTGTFTFTASVDGNYLLIVSVRMQNVDVSSHTIGALDIVTSNRTYEKRFQQVADVDQPFFLSVIADMDANDTAKVQITISGNSTVIEPADVASTNFFSGSLLN